GRAPLRRRRLRTRRRQPAGRLRAVPARAIGVPGAAGLLRLPPRPARAPADGGARPADAVAHQRAAPAHPGLDTGGRTAAPLAEAAQPAHRYRHRRRHGRGPSRAARACTHRDARRLRCTGAASPPRHAMAARAMATAAPPGMAAPGMARRAAGPGGLRRHRLARRRLGVVVAGPVARMDAAGRASTCASRRLFMRRAPGGRPCRLVVADLALRRNRQTAGAAHGTVAAGSPLRHGHAGARYRRCRRDGTAAAATLPARERSPGAVRTTGRGRCRAPAALVATMKRMLGNVLYLMAWIVGHLPWRCLHALGDGLAWLWCRRDARESCVARRNIDLAFPALDQAERAALHRTVLRTTARQALETLALWTRPHARN